MEVLPTFMLEPCAYARIFVFCTRFGALLNPPWTYRVNLYSLLALREMVTTFRVQLGYGDRPVLVRERHQWLSPCRQ